MYFLQIGLRRMDLLQVMGTYMGLKIGGFAAVMPQHFRYF
jgi:hypothetical protein